MQTLSYAWRVNGTERELRLVLVSGTAGGPYLFGTGPNRRPIEIAEFHMMSTPVTQALWSHVMGSNPAVLQALLHPVENVSWNHITSPGGFLDRINASEIRAGLACADSKLRFRIPSETEWEYAARGGPNWRDDFAFSGSNNIDQVAWYGPRFSSARRLVCRLLGWRLTGRFPPRKPTHTH